MITVQTRVCIQHISETSRLVKHIGPSVGPHSTPHRDDHMIINMITEVVNTALEPLTDINTWYGIFLALAFQKHMRQIAQRALSKLRPSNGKND